MNRMKNKISQAGFTLVELILAHTSFEPITGIAVLRVVGILVVPLGCVLGYM